MRPMKKLLVATFVALLMAGCGDEAQKKAVQEEIKDVLHTQYYENGQKKFEGNLTWPGKQEGLWTSWYANFS